MSDLATELEERIASLEGDLRVAVAPDFDARSWLWIVALGILLPAALLLVGWWVAPGSY